MRELVRHASWNSDRHRIRTIREAVFIQEQQVPADLEWDEQEETAEHFLVFSDNIAVGTGRLTPDGKIGRMAIKKSSRGLGLGAELLKVICHHALQNGYQRVYLHAQQHAEGFYVRSGFIVEGTIFYEAGIPHIKMVKELT
ncbi:GNAT family N-acetyltransferase [Microbulbifer sp. OS29]|uniref:GNAT family N-acetyltransferase n=1 Tax=Microbulbifer okhotskensis TaxID=2926617 RepID=A0A9X2J7C4_9GAMM|nr:GNAT family N-acetyltransferase [Microbulbifer okhotskensis]MCO1334321.1 GNAT family N-acetyltransferase [Microbulbifer okhotskensis]